MELISSQLCLTLSIAYKAILWAPDIQLMSLRKLNPTLNDKPKQQTFMAHLYKHMPGTHLVVHKYQGRGDFS